MFEIKGLDKLQHDLTEAQKALESLDGDLGSVTFDPNDPFSVELALQTMTRIVDERVGAYASNPVIGPLAEEMKARFREAILNKAAAARSQDNEASKNVG